MSGPRISELPLWERHEQRVLHVLRSALHRLRKTFADGGEPELNRELYMCMLEVNAVNKRSGGEWVDGAPIWESRNQPTPSTEGSASERKIPDLQWQYFDHQEPDARRGVRSFVIECKRLGSPSESGWNFNVRYVNDGVGRFIDPGWRYGKDVTTGAMVGYMESLSFTQILVEINGALDPRGLPALAPPPDSGGPLIELEHSFNRPFEIIPFRLVHLWIDVRPSGHDSTPT